MVPKSVLDAIRMGFWDFEPSEMDSDEFDWTDAMPGTKEKLRVLAERVRGGFPLWHPDDRDDIEQAPRLIKRPR